jgi:hypothetical protein
MGACSKIPNAVQVEDLPKLEACMGDMGDWMLMLQEMGNTLEYKTINA